MPINRIERCMVGQSRQAWNARAINSSAALTMTGQTQRNTAGVLLRSSNVLHFVNRETLFAKMPPYGYAQKITSSAYLGTLERVQRTRSGSVSMQLLLGAAKVRGQPSRRGVENSSCGWSPGDLADAVKPAHSDYSALAGGGETPCGVSMLRRCRGS